jgi:histidyl-tRNA synthetase
MCARLWERLGLSRLTLQINTLGSPETRSTYREELVNYFSAVKSQLDEDSIRRLGKNPLRILDSKNPEMQGLIAAAPVMVDYLDEESAAHFAGLRSLLDAAGVPYEVNPRLVRGLDYYNLTVFEWVTDALGSQGAVCAGGRYDGLVEKLGGRSTPAIGWAMGVERLVALYEACGGAAGDASPDVYLVAVGEPAFAAGVALAEKLRDTIPGIKVELNLGGGSFKSQLKRADKSGAEFAVILGDDEVSRNEAGLKPLRSGEEQTSESLDELAGTLAERLKAQE